MTKSFGVFIGRFAPLHNGHLEVIKYGEANFDELLIIIGSAEQSLRLSNPFTWAERHNMVRAVTKNKTVISPTWDYPYNDVKWANKIRDLTDLYFDKNYEATLLSGNEEWYFKLFPEYKKRIIPIQTKIHATNIRNWMYRRDNTWTKFVPPTTLHFLDMVDMGRADDLCEEYAICELQKERYPGIAVTADALITYQDKVLLVTRGKYPGKGQLALPGGFLEKDEWLEECVRRELKEECDIVIGYAPGRSKVFDWPKRSSRNRTITHCFHWEAPLPFKPNAGDDAAFAAWYQIDSLDPTKMFEDHYHIIQEMLHGY